MTIMKKRTIWKEYKTKHLTNKEQYSSMGWQDWYGENLIWIQNVVA
jgi:hypothetical protein